MTYENYDILISVSQINSPVHDWNTVLIICRCLRLFHTANGRDLMALNARLPSRALQRNFATHGFREQNETSQTPWLTNF